MMNSQIIKGFIVSAIIYGITLGTWTNIEPILIPKNTTQDIFTPSGQQSITPISATSNSNGPVDWDFGSSDYSFLLPRDGQGVFEIVNSTTSNLYQNNVTQVSFDISKVNNPRGNVTIGVWNDGGSLVKQIAVVNASTFTTNSNTYSYNVSGGIDLAVGDKLGLSYNDNSGNPKATFITPMNITSGTGEFTLHGATSTIHAEKVPSTSSPLYNQETNTIIVRLRKAGAPSGNIEAAIYNSTGNPIYKYGTLNINSISTVATDFVFYNATTTKLLAIGDYIGIKYTGGDTSNNLKVFTDAANPFNGTTTYRSTFNAGVWTDNTAVDMRLIVTKLTLPNSNAHWGLDFDGTDDYAFLPTKNIFVNGTSNLTIIARVHPDVYKSMTIIGNYRESTDGWTFKLDSDNRPTFQFRSIAGSDRTYSARYQIAKDEESFIAFTYDGTIPKFRINEQFDNRENSGTHTIRINDVQMLRIGHRANAAGEFWNGYINEIQIWNRTLTDQEIENAYYGIQPSSTNQLINYNFDAGAGPIAIDTIGGYHAVRTNNADAKINPIYNTTSSPNFVSIKIDKDGIFDNTEILNDPIRGQKFTWVHGINNDLTNLSIDTHTILNRTMLYDLKNRGVDFVILSGVHSAFNGGHAVYTNVWIPWINLAHSEGIKVYAASFEDIIYLHEDWSDSDLQIAFNDILTPAGTYFDGWTTNIEPVNLANYTANKAYYLERWMNITNVLGNTAADYGKAYFPTLELAEDDADIASLTIYTNGIDDLNSNVTGVIVESYKLNSTLVNSAISPIITSRTIPQFYLITMRDVGSSNKHNIDEWRVTQKILSNYNSTYDHVQGVGGYSWKAFIQKTDTVFVKHSLLTKYNGTNYINIQHDLAGSVITTTERNANEANDNNISTFWQNNNPIGNNDYVYVDLGEVIPINKVQLRTISGYTPASIDIYISDSFDNWGSPASSINLSNTITGFQNITFSTIPSGQFVKIQINNLGSADSFKLIEFDINEQLYTITQQPTVSENARIASTNVAQTIWTILTIAPFLLFFSLLAMFVIPKFVDTGEY